jgi:ATP-dependent DNA helicase DinG
VQGEAPRAALLQRLHRAHRGILLGVASFWEGVDVPGDPLRGLIITKLPFKVPSEPLTPARIEAIDADGGNSFHDYMLPHAALRLKQGFGRLVRTRTDRGAVVILDPRCSRRGTAATSSTRCRPRRWSPDRGANCGNGCGACLIPHR